MKKHSKWRIPNAITESSKWQNLSSISISRQARNLWRSQKPDVGVTKAFRRQRKSLVTKKDNFLW